MPCMRGRGNRIMVHGRGSRSIEPSLPSRPHVQNPSHSSQSLHSEPQSPGATSTIQSIIGNGQSSTSRQLSDDGQSSAIPTTEPQGSDPPVVPSSVDSRTDRTVRKNVLYVEPADDPKRFNDSKVNREIISTIIMRMPNPAPVWKRYSEHMTTTLLNNFMTSRDSATNYDRREAPIVWNIICAERYSDHLCKLRTGVLKQINSTKYVDLMGHAPPKMREEVWDGLVADWMTEKWQKKSLVGKANKAAKPECNVHTGGSKSFKKHYDDLVS